MDFRNRVLSSNLAFKIIRRKILTVSGGSGGCHCKKDNSQFSSNLVKAKNCVPFFGQTYFITLMLQVRIKWLCCVEVTFIQVWVHKPKQDSSFDSPNKIFI